MSLRLSRGRLACALLAPLAVCAASATAADIVIQPRPGSGFAVTDATGAQTRLRVNESGEITIPVLVNGVQQSLPLCFGTDGRVGPCAPGAGGTVGPQGPAGPAGPTGPTGPAGAGDTAGTGLALSGTTFSVAPTYQLPQTCTTNQVAQWSGTAWNCADASAGFALPYTGTSHSAGTAFWVNNYANGGAIVGFASSDNAIEGISAKGHGVKGTGINIDGDGVHGISSRATGVFGEGVEGNGVAGTATKGVGVYGLNTGTNAGVFGESSGYDGVHGHTSSPNSAGVAGLADQGTATGVIGVAKQGIGVIGISTSASGMSAISQSGYGIYAHSDSGYALSTDGPAQQALNQSGWVKAMLVVDRPNGNLQGYQKIIRCFNSLLPAALAYAPPCGFNLDTPARGLTSVNFGFRVVDRYASNSMSGGCSSIQTVLGVNQSSQDDNSAIVFTSNGSGDSIPSILDPLNIVGILAGSGGGVNCVFHLIVF